MFRWNRIRKANEISKSFSFSWILMWALAYICCAFIKPDSTDMSDLIPFPINPVHLSFGLLLLVALLFDLKALLLIGGVVEVLAGVASWIGVVQWNVPWTVGYDPFAQISMAVLDFVSAAYLFQYSRLGVTARAKYRYGIE
jgi:hypothetical protein